MERNYVTVVLCVKLELILASFDDPVIGHQHGAQ